MFAGRFFGGRHFGARYFGKVGLTVPGYYSSGRYLGNRYFGPRFFGSSSTDIPFALAVTNTPALSGVTQISGGFTSSIDFEVAVTSGPLLAGSTAIQGALDYEGEDWNFTPPLSVSQVSGVVSVAGDLTYTLGAIVQGGYFGSGYFGSSFFGTRYWSTKQAFALAQTNTLALTGAVQVGGDVVASIDVNPTTALAMAGVIGVECDLAYTSLNYTSASVLYVPIRMTSALWSAGAVGAGTGEVAWLPPARQDIVYFDSRTNSYKCDPAWYRFFEYIAEQRLGGKTGPTLTAVVQTLNDTQSSAATASANTTALQQQTQANAEALQVVRSVAKLNELIGAEQIPQVEL